jgi:hypothetical protein
MIKIGDMCNLAEASRARREVDVRLLDGGAACENKLVVHGLGNETQ